MSDVKLTAEDEQTIEHELARVQKTVPMPARQTHADRWVLIEGAPQVGADKKEKLEKVLLKHGANGKAGAVVHSPLNSDTGNTLGYVINHSSSSSTSTQNKAKQSKNSFFSLFLSSLSSLSFFSFFLLT
jgi:hypothetical protein